MNYFPKLRRVITFCVACLLMITTVACTPSDTSASSTPNPSAGAVERAQNNLSDRAVNENALSQQSPSEARGDSDLITPGS